MNIKERLLKFIEESGITVAEFERNSGLSNGYIKKLKGSIGSDKIGDIIRAYSNLNLVWLLIGEGEMLNSTPTIHQQQHGGTGNSQTITLGQSDVSKFLDEIAAQRRMTEKGQEQIDRLLTLLENKQ